MFWAPVPEKCENASQSRLFAPKHTFRAKVAFERKSAFLGPKGDFGWFGWNFNQFDLVLHKGSCILRILGFPWRKKYFMKIFTHSRKFHEKVNFISFYNFSRRGTENTLGFCHPSNAFPPPFEPGCVFCKRLWIYAKSHYFNENVAF